MKNPSLLFIILGIIVLVTAFYFVNNNTGSRQSDTATPTPPTANDTTAPSQTSTPSPTPSPLSLHITDANTPPKTLQLKEGDQAVIKITSDIADEIHVHGYDLTQTINPGQSSELEFRANVTGRFEIELHEREKTIAILEVYP